MVFFFPFWLSWVLVAACGIFVAVHHVGSFIAAHQPSSYGAQAPNIIGLSRCLCRLSGSAAFGILVPRPGLELMSPALKSKFSTTDHRGRP